MGDYISVVPGVLRHAWRQREDKEGCAKEGCFAVECEETMTAPQMMAACPQYDKNSCGTCRHGKDRHNENQRCATAAGRCPACTPLPAEPEKTCEAAECPHCLGTGGGTAQALCQLCGGSGELPIADLSKLMAPQPPRPTARERIEAEYGGDVQEMTFDGLKVAKAAERVIDQDARVIEGLREEVERLHAEVSVKCDDCPYSDALEGLMAAEARACVLEAENTDAKQRLIEIACENDRLREEVGRQKTVLRAWRDAAGKNQWELAQEVARLIKRCEGCNAAAFKLAFENKAEHEYRDRLDRMVGIMRQVMKPDLSKCGNGGDPLGWEKEFVAGAAKQLTAIDKFMAQRKAPALDTTSKPA